MLLSLHIENFAVIKSVDIDFEAGFTALTGETGAGKSIIIDSIGLVLGAKSEREFVRNGEQSLMVSALFGMFEQRSITILNDAGITTDDDGYILVQRSVGADGRSQVKINGRTVSLTVLKNISQALICIHGQNDTGSLLEPARHLELVDIYADNSALLAEYKVKYEALTDIRLKIKNLKELDSERERRREMLEYQINDIDSVKLHSGEEEELVDKKIKIKNSEKIIKNSEFAYKALKGSEKGSVSYLIDRTSSALEQISGIIPAFSDHVDKLKEISYQVNDIAEEIGAVIDDIDSDPTETLNKIEERLDKISKLKRKYGLTVEAILEYRDNAKTELETLDNSEELLEKLIIQEKTLYLEARNIAEQLHKRRCDASIQLEEKVKEALEFLDMPKVVFFANVKEGYDGDKLLLNSTGSDSLEFYISVNRGADAQSISKIASGGELARIMLALKGALADRNGTSTIIFDEIDSGVSGKTARKIGLRMKSLSNMSQVFCVTHSAQIASLADKHFLISKSDVDGATETSVTELDYNGRVSELSRILGGINVTEAQRKAAQDMLNIID